MNKSSQQFASIIIVVVVASLLCGSAYLILLRPRQHLTSSSTQIEQIAPVLTLIADGQPMLTSEQSPETTPVIELTANLVAQTPTMTSVEETQEPFVFEPTLPVPDPNNLVINGYFLEDYSGWTRDLIDEGGSSKTNIVNFGSSQFNRALQLTHEGLGDIIFWQSLDIPTTNLIFSASFNATSTQGPIWGFSGTGYAMIVISYQDDVGNELGFTRIINFNENMFAGSAFVGSPEKLSDSNTTHNYQIDSDKTYHNFTIDIQNELQNNLLGINASDVKSVTIAFIVGSNDKNASAELIVADVLLKPK